jgi:xanthine dehydrogenase small subunit
VKAAQAMYDLPRPAAGAATQDRDRAQLDAIAHGDAVMIEAAGCRFYAPTTLDGLAELYAENPDATILSGATDVGLRITKRHQRIGTFIYIGRVAELQETTEYDGMLRVGAGMRWADLEGILGRHYPDFGELLRRFGSVQVRNTATIGGNIANGSPIGDGPPALIVLGARLVLRQGSNRRTIPLEDFFVAYGQQDRHRGQFIEAIEVPLTDDPKQFRCYKVSKRFDEDISTVCGCFNIDVRGGIVRDARICYAGMAGTPKRASNVEGALRDRPWTEATLASALPAFEQDYTPLTDMRGSAAYRSQVAKNLLIRYFHETQVSTRQTRLVGRESAFG